MKPMLNYFAKHWFSTKTMMQHAVRAEDLLDPKWHEKLSKTAERDEWDIIRKTCGLSTGQASKLQTAQLLATSAHELYFSPPFSLMTTEFHDLSIALLSPPYNMPFTILSLDPLASSISHACLSSSGLVSNWSRTALSLDPSPSSSHDSLQMARSVKRYLDLLLADLQIQPSTTIVLIKRVHFRGPAGKIILGSLHASFIEHQLCALLTEFPFVYSLSPSKVCSYFSLPFGLVKNKACLDTIQSRSSEAVTGRRSESLLNSFIVNESLLTFSKDCRVSDRQEQEKIGFSLLQALAWLEWRNNIGAMTGHLSTRM